MKQNKDVMSLEENGLWFTVLLLLVLGFFFSDKNYFIVTLFLILNILVYGNIRRLVYRKDTNFVMFVRRFLYIVPLLFPFLIGFSLDLWGNNLVYWSIASLILGLFPILVKLKDWNIMLSYDMIGLQKKLTKNHYFSMLLVLIGLTIAEEVFFRNFLIQFTQDSLGIFAVFLSGYLFMIHHFCCKWGQKSFSRDDFLIQFLMGIIAALLFYFSGSIIPPIILHLTYNSPYLLVNFRSYIYFYHKQSQ